LRHAHGIVIRYENARSLADEYRRFADLLHPSLRERCEEGWAIEAAEHRSALALAQRARCVLDEVFGDYDVLIAPAATGEAPMGLTATGDTAMNVVWTLLHVPCVGLSAGRGPQGLPLGLQVIGRIGDDARTLTAARWIESHLEDLNR
jgi:Asp-tRNA(Asn)/Glu-tRNA(Gln) amidotransferase A subunit family amidase